MPIPRTTRSSNWRIPAVRCLAFPDLGPHGGCLVCHPTTAGPATTSPAQFFNVYGAAYNAAGPHPTEVAAIAALRSIESLNSDDDGPIVTVLTGGDFLAPGTVWSSAGGFSCRDFPCTMSFSTGDSVVLNALGDCGAAFVGWNGGGTPACTGTGPCAVRADNRTEIDRGTLPGSPSSRPTITVTATFDTGLCPTVSPPTLLPVDLVVTDLTASTAGTIGSPIEVSVTVRNQGASVAPPNQLGFFYSVDPTITTEDVASVTTCAIPPLAPGQPFSCAKAVAVPSSLSPGTYRFGAIVDELAAVPESNELNNARSADTGPITLLAAGTSPLRASLNKTSYAEGDRLSLTMSTQPALGIAPTAADFYLALTAPDGSAYLFDGADWVLIFDGGRLLPAAIKPFRANAAVTNLSEIVLEATVPSFLPAGAYAFSIVLVRAGADPVNPSNWLTPPSQAAFNL